MPEQNGKPTVIITEQTYGKSKDVFDAVTDLRIIRAADEEEELSHVVRKERPRAVVIGSEKYSGPLYDSLQKGAIIARFGVGCDGVDFARAKEKGLVVTNTPEVLESTVAELTVFIAAEVLRRVGASHEQMKRGEWSPYIGKDLHGKTWAIVGMGNIGRKLSKILSFGFGVKVLACRRNTREADTIQKECGAERVLSDFPEVVRSADIVSIHIPASQATFHFLDKNRLRLLKPGAILINTGRGSLVDENALYDLLKSGHLGGAGLDVFEHEPYVPIDPDRDLRTLPNVVLTPHIGSSTSECVERMAKRVLRNIQFSLEGKHEQMDVKTE